LTISDSGAELRVDANSGRLIEFAYVAPDKVRQCHLSFREGAFDRAVQEIQAVTAAHPKTFDDIRTEWTQFVFVIIDEFFETTRFFGFNQASRENHQRASAVLNRILSTEILTSLDKLWAQKSGKSNEVFFVPPEQAIGPNTSMKTLVAMIGALIFNL